MKTNLIKATANLIRLKPRLGGGYFSWYRFELATSEDAASTDDLEQAVKELGFTRLTQKEKGGYPGVEGLAPKNFKFVI